MSDVTINYKGAAISTMDASGTKTLLTEGKYCEDDIEVVYVKPSGGGVVIGTFSPASNSQTVTLTDCIGCTSICIYPTTSIVAPGSGRTHWGCMIIDGVCKMKGSGNSSNSSWSLSAGTGDTLDSSTGMVTITLGTSTNYGGYWTSGMTYAYRAW